MNDSIWISAILLKNSNDNNNKVKMFLLSLEIVLCYKLLYQMLVVYKPFGQKFLWPVIVLVSRFCTLSCFKPFLTFLIYLAWNIFLRHWYRCLYMACQDVSNSPLLHFHPALLLHFSQNQVWLEWGTHQSAQTLGFIQTQVIFPIFKTQSRAQSLASLQICVLSYLWIIRRNRWEQFSN